MQTTANYGLKKPEGNDTVDIDVINGNMDMVDGELKKLSSAIGDDPNFKTTLSSAISVKTNQTDFNNHVNALTAHSIGDRTQLKTAAKDTIVNALNELKIAIPSVPLQSVNGKTGSVSLGASDITVSDLSNHFSSNPKNVENVLAELFTSGTNGKNDIYNAISAKGTTPTSKNFSDLVSAIGNISTGKKFASGTGTMSSNHAIVTNLNFRPFLVFIYLTNPLQYQENMYVGMTIILDSGELVYAYTQNYYVYSMAGLSAGGASASNTNEITDTGFNAFINNGGGPFKYYAYGA